MKTNALPIVLFWLALTTIGQSQPPDGANDEPATKALVVSEEVRETLVPLFSSIATADTSRATVELTAQSTLAGEVVNQQKSTYQIASRRPDQFTIYLKEPNQRTRIYGSEESLTIIMSPRAYVQLPEPISIQDAAISLPVPLGPYPEPVLALSLAGVDPAISLFGGMKSVELVDRKDFRDKVPALHFRGVQKDGVTWDLWIRADKSEEPAQLKPLRLLVDLTSMLRASPDVSVPDDFAYLLKMDFLSWRVGGEVDDALFQFQPPEKAVKYDSMDAYYQSLAGVTTEHPLLGKPAPNLVAKTLDGRPVNSSDAKDKVVVLDFWATWCEPCLAAVPVIKDVTKSYRDDVVFYAVNVGEEAKTIKRFVDENEWDLAVLVDPDESIAEAFRADALPQTVIIGADGVIESVHVGFAGVEGLRQRLTDELDVLTVGGKIASAKKEQNGGENQ